MDEVPLANDSHFTTHFFRKGGFFMKKAMKTLPLAIAFALLAAFIPLLSGGGMTARADGDFTIENGVLKKYNGSGGYVVVPDGVKTIDERAFYNNLTITGVRLPDSVMQIKSFAFYACANLKEATLPSDLRTIGTSAFYECNLQSLTLPGSLTYVDSGAFGRNRALSSVTISRSAYPSGKRCVCGLQLAHRRHGRWGKHRVFLSGRRDALEGRDKAAALSRRKERRKLHCPP